MPLSMLEPRRQGHGRSASSPLKTLHDEVANCCCDRADLARAQAAEKSVSEDGRQRPSSVVQSTLAVEQLTAAHTKACSLQRPPACSRRTVRRKQLEEFFSNTSAAVGTRTAAATREAQGAGASSYAYTVALARSRFLRPHASVTRHSTGSILAQHLSRDTHICAELACPGEVNCI